MWNALNLREWLASATCCIRCLLAKPRLAGREVAAAETLGMSLCRDHTDLHALARRATSPRLSFKRD